MTGMNYTQALTGLLSETRLDPLPDGWHMAGSRPAQYDAGLLPRTSAYDGKRVIRLRFRAVIQGQEIADWAGIWLRVDTANGDKALDNMQDRPLRGTTAWTEAASVLDVGEEAVSVHFGVLLDGAGAVDLAGPRFEVVGADVPVTKIARKPLAPSPR